MHYDVFNGDADGIIALLQLRLENPRHSVLITGVKRDIKLLQKVVNAGNASSVNVLDVSMEKNIEALLMLLDQGVSVFYCDHHRTGKVPTSNYLKTKINLHAEICTSLLINQELNGKYIHWAIAAAFGDNLLKKAENLSRTCGLDESDIRFLKKLGILINYNSYGASEDDLHIHPKHLFERLMHYKSPFMLRDDPNSPLVLLESGYDLDRKYLNEITAAFESDCCRVFELPSEAWARRISGVFGNELANLAPNKAHAVLTLNADQQSFSVNLRAPLNNRVGADEICVQFPSGGGRKGAAGINRLSVDCKAKFLKLLSDFYSKNH